MKYLSFGIFFLIYKRSTRSNSAVGNANQMYVREVGERSHSEFELDKEQKVKLGEVE